MSPAASPNPKRERLVVLVPCLNEEANVAAAAQAVLAEADKLPMELAVLLLDDGSTDGTRQVIEQLCKDEPRCHAIFHEKNQGVGATFVEGVNWANDEDWVTVHPGDNEFDFWSIHRFVAMRKDFDLILGYPQNAIVRTTTRRLASLAFHLVTQVTYGFEYRYLNGFWLFRARHFKGIPVKSGGHAFCPEFIAKAQLRYPSLRIGEAPYVSRGRKVGGSRAFTPKAIFRAVREFGIGLHEVAQYREQMVGQVRPEPPKEGGE